MYKFIILSLAVTLAVYAEETDPIKQTKPYVPNQPSDQQQPQQQPSILPVPQPDDSSKPVQVSTRDIPASELPPAAQGGAIDFGSTSSSSPNPNFENLGGSTGVPQDRIQNNPVFCTKHYDPVCGSNGQTYPNSCRLNQAQTSDPTLTESHRGEC